MAKQWHHEPLTDVDGAKVHVYAVRLPDGSCPALDWLRSLSEREQAAVKARLDMLAERGWLKSPDAFRNLSAADSTNSVPRVDEIKHVGTNIRVYVAGFVAGSSEAFVTHGSYKPSKKRVKVEVARALEIYTQGMTP
jgi:hypothetical protein